MLKRSSASRRSGEWNDDDFDVLADGVVVGRIMKAAVAPVGQPWLWTLAFSHHEDRTPDPRLRADAPGCDGAVRKKPALEYEAGNYVATIWMLIYSFNRIICSFRNGWRT